MRIKNIISFSLIAIAILGSILGCDENEGCVDKNKLDVELLSIPSRTILYENDTFLVFAQDYFTPNYDGWYDCFDVYLNKKVNESLYWEDYLEVRFSVSDKCNEIFNSTDNELLHWDGMIGDEKAKEGIYYFELFGILPNHDTIDVSGSFELHRY